MVELSFTPILIRLRGIWVDAPVSVQSVGLAKLYSSRSRDSNESLSLDLSHPNMEPVLGCVLSAAGARMTGSGRTISSTNSGVLGSSKVDPVGSAFPYSRSLSEMRIIRDER